MRLLNTLTLTLHEFITEKPEYAILSHTWEDGEVTFHDLDKPYAKDMPGYQKILKCCEQAVKDGFLWTWIDTCCIDKSSSAELSEAINSMFTWYWEAETCYAYMADVGPRRHNVTTSDFADSRWFRRGWTLQELLAPSEVEFFDQDWAFYGSKSTLVNQITQTTQIAERYLLSRETVHDANISTVFSWASHRETKRPEDAAYCLLGLFRVNIPLLYGEGTRAFYRLQLELIRKYEDQTIFAWNPLPGDFYEAMGILAPSPRHFQDGARYVIDHKSLGRTLNGVDLTTYEMTNRGLRIALPGVVGNLAILRVRITDGEKHMWQRAAIRIESGFGPFQYRRVPYSMLKVNTGFDRYTHTIFIEAESRLKIIPSLYGAQSVMQIETIHVEVPEHQLRMVAFYRGAVIQLHPNIQPKAQQTQLENVEIFDHEWISLNFTVRGVSFTVTAGQSHHIPSVEVRLGEAEDVQADLEVWARERQSDSRYVRAHNRQGQLKTFGFLLDSSVRVQVSATKLRTIERGPRWAVAIEILEPPWGIPPEETAVIQDRLRLAGVYLDEESCRV